MSSSMCWAEWPHTDWTLGELTAAKALENKDHSPLSRVSCLNGGWKRNKSLTEWELLCRVASTPGSAVHVCSFSPALRFDSSVLSELCLSSSLPSSLCSLLTADIFSSSWKCAPSAQQNNPSAKMQDTVLMFTNNKKGCPTLSSTNNSRVPTLLGSTCPPHHLNASSMTAHPPPHGIGQHQNNLQSHWTAGIIQTRDVKGFLVSQRPLVEGPHKRPG